MKHACPEEQEDWVRELREAWPNSSPPLHLRPKLASSRKPAIWVFWVPELAVVALVLLLWRPWVPVTEPPAVMQNQEVFTWPNTWTSSDARNRVGFRQRRQEDASPNESAAFPTRRSDLRLRLQRAGRRLNPNPIGS